MNVAHGGEGIAMWPYAGTFTECGTATSTLVAPFPLGSGIAAFVVVVEMNSTFTTESGKKSISEVFPRCAFYLRAESPPFGIDFVDAEGSFGVAQYEAVVLAGEVHTRTEFAQGITTTTTDRVGETTHTIPRGAFETQPCPGGGEQFRTRVVTQTFYFRITTTTIERHRGAPNSNGHFLDSTTTTSSELLRTETTFSSWSDWSPCPAAD